MHPHNGCVDHLNGLIISTSKCGHNPAPYSGPSPTDETVVAVGVWAIAFRQIAPRCAGSQHPEDAIEDTSIVHTRHATGFVRKEWLDGGPFKVSQPIPHDSRLQFESLNHGHSGHGRTSCWLDPVANDPRSGHERADGDSFPRPRTS